MFDFYHNKPAEMMKPLVEKECEKVLYPTSTARAYNEFIEFYDSFKEYRPLIPICMYTVLILECFVECWCNTGSCAKDHGRQWFTNFIFLATLQKLDHIIEFRFVMLNECPSNLNMDAIFKRIGMHRSVLSNVRLIAFIGKGIFEASRSQPMALADSEATRTAEHILSVCPNTTSLVYNTHHTLISSAGVIRDIPGVGFEIIKRLYVALLPRLTAVQILRPFPNVPNMAFAWNLTKLVINHALIPELTHLPRIPVDCLTRVEIYGIQRVPNWRIFETAPGNKLVFPCLEKITLQYSTPDRSSVQPTNSQFTTIFPEDIRVEVPGLSNADVAFQKYFAPRSIQLLSIYEDPRAFESLNLDILKCARSVHISYRDERLDPNIRYNCQGIYSLYARYNNWITGARFDNIPSPLPLTINWISLEWLDITANIADVKSICNIIHQLRHLHTFYLSCFSMDRGDLNDPARGVDFADQDDIFSGVDTTVDRIHTCIGLALRKLHIFSHKRLDVDGILWLVGRLPYLQELGLNPNSLDEVPLSMSRSGITVCGFNPHIEAIDG
ncbi:hypothetical protein DL89DRAFT_265820 [Linderina pennispora]|uniref:F-box domain-containing protein n=1 Tax=Linderina pennispora TaxID=61395 RepID=A0A1Y1WFL6_9FUNG|nr:uncharacterized protein DL89DRAFT_265820 [Linderina pennispora]ORX72195.1 hypothetical protein DL89DRAFT_265820 [Linderina pennispora]